MILQHCTPDTEGNLEGIDTYDVIEIDQDGIELANLIRNIYHLQDYKTQDIMAEGETNKRVYLFYQSPYKSDYPEALKEHLKVSKAHNVSVEYNMVLSEIALQKNRIITSNNV